jgi:lysophospholipase L1-like esterase
MTKNPALSVLPLLVALAACGGGSSPSGPTPQPSPSTVPGATVTVVLYYDENANGRADGGEGIRIPDVEVTIGGRSARTEKTTGRAVITGVPAGAQTLSVRADTVPPFFAVQAPGPVQVSLPGGGETMVGLTLPIDDNQTNTYMAFGDSITRGDGGSAGGYPADLQRRLAAHFGGAFVNNRGADSTNSFEGVERARRNLNSRPAYTLILYGTNDWNAPECQDNPACHTVDNLRAIVQATKSFRSLPFIATIPPTNPALTPAGRIQWVADVNNLIRPMAQQQGAFLVDVEKTFLAQGGDLSRFFSDHVHPNDAGYALIAQTFFEAIAHGRSTPSAAAVPEIFTRSPR